MGLGQYLKETQAELKHVSWPTQKQITYFTIVVIIISIITAVFLGVADLGFSRILQFVMELK
ncbi:MAG: preprotein translocase subunit SecE [Candidatus Pacebacteria bacterium]|nr:preprotein translocase subunit SecE [Candidatus Paceibacterota bacterium]